MKLIRNSNEDEMILEFLNGELSSERFNDKLKQILKKLDVNKKIIINGDFTLIEQNNLRKQIMKNFRGYPNKELFNNFPNIYRWDFVEFDKNDIDKIYYINYDYWNELSNGTSKPKEAAKTIKQGIEIYDIANQPFIDGLRILEKFSFPPVILITCNNFKFLIIEGHSRMTIYAMNPEKFDKTYGYIGYCNLEDMEKYDSRMI